MFESAVLPEALSSDRRFHPPPPGMREYGCPTHEIPEDPSGPPRGRPAYVDRDTTPVAGRASRSKVAVGAGCLQLASSSRPSSSTGIRITSRTGGGFPASGGRRPSSASMRFTAISSLTYATILSYPPHLRHASGSAWYTLLMSLAQLGGQRLFVGAGSAASSEPSVSLREARTRLA